MTAGAGPIPSSVIETWQEYQNNAEAVSDVGICLNKGTKPSRPIGKRTDSSGQANALISMSYDCSPLGFEISRRVMSVEGIYLT